MSEFALPPPSPALSAIKWLVLAWFVSILTPAQRERFLKALRWASAVGAGPVKEWPLDFGRPLSQAEEVIAANRSAAAWLGRLAEQLEAVDNRLPK